MTSYNVSDSQGVIISVQSSLQNVQAYVRSASAGEVDPRKREFLEAVEELRKKLEAEQARHAEEVTLAPPS